MDSFYQLKDKDLAKNINSVITAVQSFCFYQIYMKTGDLRLRPNEPIVLEGRYCNKEIYFISACFDAFLESGRSSCDIPIYYRTKEILGSCKNLNKHELNPLTTFIDDLFRMYFVSFYESKVSLIEEQSGSKDPVEWSEVFRLCNFMRNLISHQKRATRISRLLPLNWEDFCLSKMPTELDTIELLNGVDLFCLSMDALELLVEVNN